MIDIVPVILGVFLTQLSPGPNLIAVASSSLSSGRAAGVTTALGVASAVLFWATMFAFGIGAFLAAFPESITLMRIVGGSYLLYLGIKSLRTASNSKEVTLDTYGDSIHLTAAYLRGLFVNLTNPKTALMWVAISMYLGASGIKGLPLLIVGLAVSASAAIIYSSYAFILSTDTAIRSYSKFYRVIEGLFGFVFGFIGGKLLLDGLREIKAS